MSNKDNSLIAGTFSIGKVLGSGSFGEVRLGVNVTTGLQVAIKMESLKAKDPQLQSENEIYKLLQNKSGFPAIYYFGQHQRSQVMVMQLLSSNLAQLLTKCSGKFSLKTTLYATLQVLQLLETVHSCGIVYRDLKPENVMTGIDSNALHIVDFGLSGKYLNENSNHIAYGKSADICGTPIFMSVNCHRGYVTSRRDDLESLSYLSIYLISGYLPWLGLSAKSTNEAVLNQRICAKKETLTAESMCKNLPKEFAQFLNYAKNMEFTQTPNYDKLRKLYLRLFEQNQFSNDGVYDWNVNKKTK